MSVSPDAIRTTRRIAGAIAAVVMIDVLWVKAPFLAELAVPFAIVAWRYRARHTSSSVGVIVLCMAYAAIGVSFALTNGLHAPAEPNQVREVINPGDFAFAYVGTPLAVWLAVRVGASLRRRPIAAAAA